MLQRQPALRRAAPAAASARPRSRPTRSQMSDACLHVRRAGRVVRGDQVDRAVAHRLPQLVAASRAIGAAARTWRSSRARPGRARRAPGSAGRSRSSRRAPARAPSATRRAAAPRADVDEVQPRARVSRAISSARRTAVDLHLGRPRACPVEGCVASAHCVDPAVGSLGVQRQQQAEVGAALHRLRAARSRPAAGSRPGRCRTERPSRRPRPCCCSSARWSSESGHDAAPQAVVDMRPGRRWRRA